MDKILPGLASFIDSAQWQALPEDATRSMKMLLPDSVGCALAGITTDPGIMTCL